jgi:hypothetical protein
MADKELLLRLYDEQQSILGTDKIAFDQSAARNTPYSIDDEKNADEQVLTAEKFKTGRGGQVNNVLYSSTITR